MKKFFIVDGSSYIYRAYYGIPHLNNSKGQATNAVFGFLKMIRNTINKHKPDYLLIALDSKEKNFRKEIFPEYKSNRKETPDSLKVQIPHINRLIKVLNIKSLSIEGIEADDIIASLVKKFSKDLDISIVSADKDLMQLINKDICMIDTMKNITYCEKDVLKKFSVTPNKILDYLALTGDTSDNIPGVKGIGPKKAANLINEFGSLENIYKEIDSIKNLKTKNSLLENKDNAFLSKKLISLKKDLKIHLDLDDLKTNNYNNPELINFLKEFEFYSELKNIYKEENSGIINTNTNKSTKYFDKNNNENNNENISHKENYKLLDTYTITNNKTIIGYDLLSRINSKNLFDKELFDIKIAYYLLNPGKRDYPIDDISFKYTSKPFMSDLLFDIKKGLEIDLKSLDLEKVFYEIDIPSIPILKKISEYGISLDLKVLNDLSSEYIKKINNLRNKIYETSEVEFNINSPKQLSEILFEKLKLPKIRKTQTGYSTNQEVLEELSIEHKLPSLIIEYREFTKLLNTYVKPLIREASLNNGKVHTTYTLDITATGRISSINPNLQNIPIKTSSKIRKVFIAEKNKILISADYSQIELRILSYLANDKTMQNAFKDGEDIHMRTASEIFDTNINLITKLQRSQAKAVNFGIMYGKTPYGLSKELGIPISLSKNIINKYFKTYSGISEYRDNLVNFAKTNGFTKTYFGRIRYLPDINSNNKIKREFAIRNAINSPIQGTAADILKLAMIKLSNKLRLSNLDTKIVMNVHDELVLEAKNEDKEIIVNILKESMESVVNFNPKLKIDIKVGNNWLEMERI